MELDEHFLCSLLSGEGKTADLGNLQRTRRSLEGSLQGFHPVVRHRRCQRGCSPSHTILKPAQRGELVSCTMSECLEHVVLVDLVRVGVERFFLRLRRTLVPEIEEIRHALEHAHEIALREAFTGEMSGIGDDSDTVVPYIPRESGTSDDTLSPEVVHRASRGRFRCARDQRFALEQAPRQGADTHGRVAQLHRSRQCVSRTFQRRQCGFRNRAHLRPYLRADDFALPADTECLAAEKNPSRRS